jgi:hypothetical protein
MKHLSRVWEIIKNPSNRTFVIATGIVVGLPIVILCSLAVAWSVNAPFWDQWIYADLLDKLRNGTLSFHDLWQQHNEHRIFFPKIIQLIAAIITHWNVRFEVIMNLLAAITTYGFLVWLAFKTLKNRAQSLIAAAVIAWLVFSPLAYVNWIWGLQFAWYLSVLALVVSLWGIYRSKQTAFDIWFWTAIIAAIVCNYSLGNGMLAWVAGGLVLWMRGMPRTKLLTWSGAAIAAICIYFYHFTLGSGSLSALLHRPLEGVQYVLQYLGHNLGPDPGSALMAGAILLAIGIGSVIITIREKQLVVITPWVGLASYGLLTAAVAAATRMGQFGVDHSMSFSYTTVSALFVIGVAVMGIQATVLMLPAVRKWSASILVIIGVVIGLVAYPLGTGYVQNYLIGIQKMHEQSQHLNKIRECIYSVRSADDPCLLNAFPDKQQIWNKLHILKDIHWGHF